VLNTILFLLLFVLLAFAAVKVAVALILLVMMGVSGLVRYVLVPVVYGLTTAVSSLVTMPFRAVAWMVGPAMSPVPAGGPPVLKAACGNRDCRCLNPAGARFCRRCGIGLQ
jgi:hypothetical protein